MSYILFTLIVCLHAIFGEESDSNTTNPTSAPTTEPTMMYTSLNPTGNPTSNPAEPTASPTLLQSILIADDDPTNNDEECLFDTSFTVNEGEEIEVAICGYQEIINEGEQDEQIRNKVILKLNLPIDKWFGIGFVSKDDFDENNAMKGYTIIVPFESRDIEERILVGTGAESIGNPLSSSVEVISDITTDGRRTLRLARYVTLELNDIGGSNSVNLQNLLSYFDFTKLSACEQEIRVIYAWSALQDQQWDAMTYHGNTNRGSQAVGVDAVNDRMCDAILNYAHCAHHTLVALVVSAFAAFLISM